MEILQGIGAPTRGIGGGWLKPRAIAFAAMLALGLSGCGGGGGGGGSNIRPTPPPAPPPPAGPPAPPTSIHSDYTITFDNEIRTWTQAVSGDGQLVKGGSGTLVLSGANTYSGGTTVAGGALEMAPGGSLGSGSARVGQYTSFYYPSIVLKVDSGVSLSNHILVGMYGVLDTAGTLGGSADVAVEGGDCNPTYGSCPDVRNHDGGTIRASDHAVQMNSLGNVTNNNGSLIEGGNAAVWLAAGSVSNDGDGSVIRSPNGSAIDVEHGQGQIVNTGGAVISSGGTAIILAYGGSVTNGAGSTIETQGTTPGGCVGPGGCAIYAGSGLVSGVTLNNEGTILGNVQMVATAHNSTTLWAGSLIQGYLDMGTNQGSFFTLNGDAGSVQRYSNAVAGTTTFTGILNKKGLGSWIVDSNDLDHVVQAYVEGGTLQIGDGGTTGQVGSATSGYYAPTLIQIASGARLVFNRSDDVVYWGSVGPLDSGAGGLVVQMGTGDLKFPDLRQIGGLALVVEHGSVTLGDGSFQKDSVRPVSVTNNGKLTLDNDGEVYLESVISGSGSLIKQGAGMLSLDGANTYTGSTTVGKGTLRAMKMLPGNAIVNPGAVLQGAAYNGTPPGLPGTTGDLYNGGRVEVGSGDARIGGSYTNTTTGTLAISLGSKLDVAGTVTLNGGTLEIKGADSGYVSNTHTNVLTAAGGVTGTFDQLVKGAGVVFTATTINYDANSVWLDTTGLNVTTAAAGNGVSYTAASLGGAQRVQGAFELLNADIAAGKLPGVSGDFLRAAGQFQRSPSLLAAQASLQSLSGQLHATSASMTFKAIDASSRALSDRFDNLLSRNTGFGTWAHSLSIGGDMARAGFDDVGFQLNGWLIGSDRQIGHSGVAGYAFGQSRGQQRLNQGLDHDNIRSTEGMLYAGWLNGHWYAQGRAGFGHFQQDVGRQILLGDSAQGVRTQYSGRYGMAYGESGLHFDRGDSHVTPFVNVQYARIGRGGFAEQGAGGFGLRSNAQMLDRWQAALGVRAGHHWNLDGGRAVDFSARAQWQRTLASHGDVFNASFVGLEAWRPLAGIGLSRYSGLIGLGLDAALSAHAMLKFGYDCEMGQHDNAQMLSVHLNVAI